MTAQATATPAQDRVATFEGQRRHLFGVAYRMLGSVADAEDVVQDAWLRWSNVRPDDVRDPRAYLTAVVTRLCLDQCKSARVKRERYIGSWLPEPIPGSAFASPEPGAVVAVRETLSYAFMVLLERLGPAERAVFLLRDVFDFDYAEIAPMVDRTEAACRQLLHRARTRITSPSPRFSANHAERLRLTAAFVQAAGAGDMQALTDLLAADVVAISDGGGKANAAINPVHGRDFVARYIVGVTRKNPPIRLQFVEVNDNPAILTWHADGPPTLIMVEGHDGEVTVMYAIRNPDKLAAVMGSVE